MKQNFNQDTKIIISDKIRNRLEKNNYVNFVFPVILYKVRFPNLLSMNLNFFQKFVLEILKIDGSKSIFDISSLLCLDSTLVEYVFNELIDKGYYDAHRKIVSDSGIDALKNIYNFEDEVEGYFIYDLACNRFLDYFFSEDDFKNMIIKHRYDETGELFLTNKHTSIVLDYISDKGVKKEEMKENIYDAYCNYIYSIEKLSKNNKAIPNLEIIDRIKIEEPQYYYYYISTNVFYKNGIIVDDAFLSGMDDYLTDFFNNNKREDYIVKIISNLKEYQEIKNLSDTEEREKELFLEHINKIIPDENFISEHKDFLLKIYLIFKSYQQLKKEQNIRDYNNNLSNFIKRLYEALEITFYHNIKDYKKLDRSKINRNKNNEIITKMATDLNFTNIRDISLFLGDINKDTLSKLDRENLQHLITANLLYEDKSLLIKLQRKYPNLFTILFYLKSIRNSIVHSNSKNYKITKENIDNFLELFLYCFSLSFNVEADFSKMPEIKISIENKVKAENLLKLQISNATQENEYQEFEGYVLAMFNNFVEGVDIDTDISKIFEYIVNNIIEFLGEDKVMQYVKETIENIESEKIKNIESDIKYCLEEKYGFYLEEEVVDIICKISGNSNILNTQKTLTNSIIHFIIYSIYNEEGAKILKKISENDKNFINSLFKYGRRAHNKDIAKKDESKINIITKENEEELNDIYNCINSFLSLELKK